MIFKPTQPPRRFRVGQAGQVELADCGSMALAADEQITFVTGQGGEFDVTRKAWGFYATPSLNGRLASFGLRAALIRNVQTDRYFVALVERGHEADFDAYLVQETCEVVAWLDSTEALDRLRAHAAGAGGA